jgi:hypothetical protein
MPEEPMMRFAVFVLAIASVLGACAAPIPPGATDALTPGPTPQQVLYLENRGGPPFAVFVDDAAVVTVDCGSSAAVSPDQPDIKPMPWDLAIISVRDRSTVLSTRVTELPRWFVQLGGDKPDGLSTMAVLGPAVTCPPSEAPTPSSTPTFDPYAGLPSNACGGFHLKIVNDTSSSIEVSLNDSWSTSVGAGTTEVINETFSQPMPPPMPWRVVITNKVSGQQLFDSTMNPPVDQKVTLSDGGAVQTPFDLMTEDC